MRNWTVAALALALVAGMMQHGSAAEPGRKMSKSALANLGLGGARRMSDAEGLRVRGMSISIVMGVGAGSVIRTNANGQTIASSVQTGAYGSVDDSGNRTRAIGDTGGVAVVNLGNGNIVRARFGGGSFARSGFRPNN